MTARCALPELLRLMEKDRVAQGIKKHYPGGKDHDQSNHGRARWTPDVPPSSQRERFAVSSDRWKSIEGISPFEEELPKAIKDWIGLGTYKGGDMSAFSGYRLSGPVTVFRGERAVAQGGKPRELSSYEVGDTVTFDGPTSTSLSPAVAVDFAFGGDKVGNLYEIDLPRGAKALGVTPKDKMGGDVSTLSEVIVEPMSFTVTGVREEQVYIHPNLPQYKATIYTLEPTREDLAKLVRLAKHPGPGGSELHSSGSDQSVHGGRISALQGANVKGPQIVAETMTMEGLPESLQDKIRETLATRWSDGMTQTDIEKNYAKVLAYAEKLYAENPPLRDEHRFYEQWFDVFEDHALGSDYAFKQIAGAGAAISPGLEAETNLVYAQEMAEILADDAPIPDWQIPMLNWTMNDKRELALADHFPDNYPDPAKAGKPKKPSPDRAKDWEFTFEEGMKLSDVTSPHAALMAIREVYNRKNTDSAIPRFFAPKGYDNFAKAVEILRGADIDATLTGGKVRSFYNNFLDPTDLSGAGDVTIDFQMMEAGLWVGGGSSFPSSLSSTPGRFGAELGIRPIMGDAVKTLLPEWGPRVGAESPGQLQEIIWAVWKHGKDTGEWGDLPALRERK